MASCSWAISFWHSHSCLPQRLPAYCLPSPLMSELSSSIDSIKSNDKRVSNYRHRNGAPSCDELDKVLRPSDIYDERTRQQQREQFRWNDGERKS